MKLQIVLNLVQLAAFTRALPVKREASSDTSSTSSPATVYTFLGDSGSASDVLEMTTATLSDISSTTSVDESSALSQFLKGGSGSTTAAISMSASETTSTGSKAVTTGSTIPSSSGSQKTSTSDVQSTSASKSGASSAYTSSSSSSSAETSASAGANILNLPLLAAGGIAASIVALL